MFDPAAVQDRAVPGNAAQPPSGIAYVVVNGEVVLDNGAMTKARPGRGLMRGGVTGSGGF